MQNSSTLSLRSLSFGESRTYLFALLFILGNIALPRLCHLMPQGGVIWLPIYFFTLVGAYKYGWRVGLLTAIASPIANSLLFSMPAPAVVPAILLKSVALALVAGFAARRFRKASVALLAAVVLAYQTVGTLGEWALTGSLSAALQDFRLGLPGMLFQVFGGWLIINKVIRK